MYDKEICRKCKYAGHIDGMTCCDYILINKKRRGCYGGEKCDKYENRGKEVWWYEKQECN